ncbi:Cytoskeleton associated protein 5 [Caligus rogercresseyi]|uniref:Cytoskeleton associated protein 5 n=1 Tax=Caligus rogercresseyi TaxID=217165 RepID=A0A7T8HN65_CALRO|nr:Cytoskeleton associated protein 5 [Caligus rogercresseyi]
MYKMIGNLPEKDMTMLEERIKRASKTRQPPSNEQQAPQTQAHQPSPPPASSNKNANIPKPGGGRSIPSRSARAQRTLGGGSPSRPMSGAFTLNYEEIEAVSEHRMSESGPRLVRHNLDDIFGDVSLPKTQTSKATFSSPPPHTATTHGGSNNYHHSSHTSPLSENSEVYEALDLIISQVFSLDIKTALNALTQLDDLIKDHEKVHLIKNRLDQFLLACCNKYKHVIFTMMPTDNCNEKDVIKLFQFTTMALMSLYHRSDITKNTSLASLHDLIELPEISSLIKAMNVLTIKIVDRSNHTNVTCAFVRLLKKSVPTSGLRPKFADLVMNLDQWMPELQIDVLLAELHEFLKAYPQSYWKMQDTDTHLRTVKTIVHMLAKSKGPDIMNYLGKIQDPENSDLLPYLQKIMHSVSAGGEDGRKTGSNGSHSSSGKHSRFSKTDHETLAEIFKKIGQKDLTKQGLEELYNFKQANPQADLEPFFARSSQYFRDFIEKGLKKIEMEVKGGSLGGGGNANLSAPNHSHGSSRFVLSDNVSAEGSGSSGVGGVGGGSGSSSSGQAHAFFLDRLKRLRTAGGLDNDDVGQENKAGGANSHMRLYAPRKVDARLLDTPSGIPTSTHSSTRSNIPESSTQIEDIRKRLEKIKQSAF